MGISRDSRHKHRLTGGRRNAHQKKRKYELGRVPANTKLTQVDGDKAYKDSKLCNVITCLELAKRLKSKRSKVTANVMNPGLIPTTGLFRAFSPLFVLPFTFLTRYVFKVAASEDDGGQRLAYMIKSPELDGVSGMYLSTEQAGLGLSAFKPITPSIEARDEKKAAKFWELTDKLISKAMK